MVEFFRQYRKSVLAVLLLAIVLVILFLVQSFTKKDVPYKEIQNHDYVFVLDSKIGENGKSSRPYINLIGEDPAAENAKIASLYHKTVQDNRNTFSYQFRVKDQLLFLMIKIDFYDKTVRNMQTRYLSYINDIETGEMLVNEEVLQKYGYGGAAIETSIRNKMQSYYNDAVSQGLIEGRECDFACYLDWKDMNDINDGTALFFKKDELVVYRGFTLKSVFADDILYDKKEPYLFALEK